jgi:hypothetical protein
MSQIRYTITMSAGAAMSMSAGINAKVLPLLHQAVRAVATTTATRWQEAVLQSKLWQGERDAYAKSITWSMTGDFTAMVETDYEHAQAIETGRPARDMKTMLDTSLKVRRTESGKRFLVIPIRHGGSKSNTNPMPASVGKMAKAMEPSKIVGTGQRPSGQVMTLSPKSGMQASAKQSGYLSNPRNQQASTVASRSYAWGGRLSGAALRQAGVSADQAKKYKGMVRMDTGTPGGAKSSTYLTFRIMMEGQTGKWIAKAQPGLNLVQKVTQEMQPKAQAAFEAAVQKTVSG